MQTKIIDVEKYLKVKPGTLFYRVQKLLARVIAGYIHEAELNELLSANQTKQGAEWALGIINTLNITIETVGEENIQKPGRYVLVGNHPLGGVDGLAVIAVAGKYHPSIKSLSDDALRIIPNTDSIIIPINPKAVNSREVVAAIDALYRSEHQVLIFPAGVVSRLKKGEIIDLPWIKTFLTKAAAFERDIIPIHVTASNSMGFYRFSVIRRFFQKITGLYLEMFSLTRECALQHGKTIRLTFGKPIPWQTFDDSRSFHAWAQVLRSYVYSLKDHPQLSFSEYLAENEAKH